MLILDKDFSFINSFIESAKALLVIDDWVMSITFLYGSIGSPLHYSERKTYTSILY